MVSLDCVRNMRSATYGDKAKLTIVARIELFGRDVKLIVSSVIAFSPL
jgi:hypothetical protein